MKLVSEAFERYVLGDIDVVKIEASLSGSVSAPHYLTNLSMNEGLILNYLTSEYLKF